MKKARDTIKKAHSFPMEEFSNVHDSIRDEFMRIATAKRRTFKNVEVMVTLGYSMEAANKAAISAVRAELAKKSEDLAKELDKLGY